MPQKKKSPGGKNLKTVYDKEGQGLGFGDLGLRVSA
jgi:hypothetical protein